MKLIFWDIGANASVQTCPSFGGYLIVSPWAKKKKYYISGHKFKYKRKIIIQEQSGNDLTDYQVRINLDSTNFDFSHFLNEGKDLAFTDAEGNPLPYWVEKMDIAAEEATIWVKVPVIPASSSVDIYMHYGSNQVTSASSIDDTFLFGDDFKITHPVLPDFLNLALEPIQVIAPNSDPSAWDGYIREKVTILRQNGLGEPFRINGKYYVYYCGHDDSGEGTSQIGLALSEDLINFEKYAGNPVIPVDSLGMCQDPSVIQAPNGDYYMYIEVNNGYIVLYTSTDLINWERYGVIKSEAASPVVWIENNIWYMLYEDMSASPETINLATSTDGINWTDNPNNPIISDPSAYCVPDSIVKANGIYYLYGHKNTSPRRSRCWISDDLINWTEHILCPINFESFVVFPFNNEYWAFAWWLQAYLGYLYSANDRAKCGIWLFRCYGSFTSDKWNIHINGDGGQLNQGDGLVSLLPNRGSVSSCAIVSNSSFVNNFAVRIKKKYYGNRYDALSIGFGDIVGKDGATDWYFTTFSNGYVWWECPDCIIKCAISRMDSGSVTDLDEGDFDKASEAEEWNIIELIYKSDGTLKVTSKDGFLLKAQAVDGTYLNDPKYIMFAKGEASGSLYDATGAPGFVDWILVRKYAEPEPSVSLGEEESE